MSHLSIESGQHIIEYNRQRIYHLPLKYKALRQILGINDKSKEYQKPLKADFLKLLKYIKSVNLIIEHHRYHFFLDTGTFTQKIRGKRTGKDVSNRYLNMYCAMGLLKKVPQSFMDDGITLNVNLELLDKKIIPRPINVFTFSRYSNDKLDEIEARCKRLLASGITEGNISYNMLYLNDCADIAEEVYPNNDETAPEKKMDEGDRLFVLMAQLIQRDGYTTRSIIKNNLGYSEKETAKLFKIFKQSILRLYRYSPPTKEQMDRWGLKDRTFIYTPK